MAYTLASIVLIYSRFEALFLGLTENYVRSGRGAQEVSRFAGCCVFSRLQDLIINFLKNIFTSWTLGTANSCSCLVKIALLR